MNDEAFADATRPTPRTILRVPLLPYSIGHELLLIRQRNPLLYGDEYFDSLPKPAQISAVVQSVVICSKTWKQNHQPEKWLRFWMWRIRKEDFSLAVAEFRIHRKEGSAFPEIFPDNGTKGRSLGSPFLARVLSFATERFGDAAFDMPLGMLQFMYFSAIEEDGGCKIANEVETQIMTEIAQHQADFDKEQEAKCQH